MEFRYSYITYLSPYLRLVTGSQNSSLYTTYQWTPDPLLSTVIAILMIVTTLLPAASSLCYHFYVRKQDILLVMK